MKTKAAIAFLIFLVIMMLPFIINAAGGHMFQNSGKPSLDSSVSVQYGQQIPPLADMQDHMNHFGVFIQEGLTPKNCLLCHKDRANFCDKCHGYVGANPSID